jgi:phytoene dehydrogenase-like protein
MSHPGEYDAIVIGAGHNGLVCASYLAEAGLKTLVLERQEHVGGACSTEEIAPGYRISSCAYLFGMLRPEIIRDLDLYRSGLDVYPTDPQMLLLSSPTRKLFSWLDPERTAKEIAYFSPHDAASYLRFLRLIDQVVAVLEPTFLAPPQTMAELEQTFKAAGLGSVSTKVFAYSIRELVEEFFHSEPVKVAFAYQALSIHSASPATPGTAYGLFHTSASHVKQYRGAWGFVRSGMGSLTEVLARVAQQRGVVIRTGVEVEHILVRATQVQGIVLAETGEVIRSPVVLSSADPKRTFLRMIDPRHLPPDFCQSVKNIKMNGGASKILCALDGLPDFKALPGREVGPQHRACSIIIAPSMHSLQQAWEDAEAGLPSQHPGIELSLPSATDESLAPQGKHVLSIYLQYTPYYLQSGNWETYGEIYADRVIDQIAEYVPNIKDILLARKIITPLELERTFYLTEGHCEHGEMEAGQLFSNRPLPLWSQYKTPVEGLYLCGSGTHPGGMVSGAPGYNAARCVLQAGKLRNTW